MRTTVATLVRSCAIVRANTDVAGGGPRCSAGPSADKAARSVRLAKRILAGLDGQGLGGSTYLVPNIAPDREQGTLNTAGLPIVIVETLNMQNPDDSALASSEEGRQRVAEGLAAGIAGYFSG